MQPVPVANAPHQLPTNRTRNVPHGCHPPSGPAGTSPQGPDVAEMRQEGPRGLLVAPQKKRHPGPGGSSARPSLNSAQPAQRSPLAEKRIPAPWPGPAQPQECQERRCLQKRHKPQSPALDASTNPAGGDQVPRLGSGAPPVRPGDPLP